MVTSSQASPTVAAPSDARPPMTVPPAERARQRRWPWRGDQVSLLWRVFGANVAVFVVAFALLAWAPIRIDRVATPGELVIMSIGLAVMLAFDLVLVRVRSGRCGVSPELMIVALPLAWLRSDRPRGGVRRELMIMSIACGDAGVHLVCPRAFAVDPAQPGRRAKPTEGSGREVVALTQALNAMLDRLEDERRESSRRALAAQEGERTRIARELHDEVG